MSANPTMRGTEPLRASLGLGSLAILRASYEAMPKMLHQNSVRRLALPVWLRVYYRREFYTVATFTQSNPAPSQSPPRIGMSPNRTSTARRSSRVCCIECVAGLSCSRRTCAQSGRDGSGFSRRHRRCRRRTRLHDNWPMALCHQPDWATLMTRPKHPCATARAMSNRYQPKATSRRCSALCLSARDAHRRCKRKPAQGRARNERRPGNAIITRDCPVGVRQTCFALSGRRLLTSFSQGDALGWHAFGPLARTRQSAEHAPSWELLRVIRRCPRPL